MLVDKALYRSPVHSLKTYEYSQYEALDLDVPVEEHTNPTRYLIQLHVTMVATGCKVLRSYPLPAALTEVPVAILRKLSGQLLITMVVTDTSDNSTKTTKAIANER